MTLARLAEERQAQIVVFTVHWCSPVAAHADYRFRASVGVASSWDSTVALMLRGEALIAQVQDALGQNSRAWVESLESMFTQTRRFRNFN